MAGVRRVWNKDEYAAKARQRLENGDTPQEESSILTNPSLKILKEEFQPASADANRPVGSERAFLKAREQALDLESKIGKTQIVSTLDAESQQNNLGPGSVHTAAAQPGWYCEVCKCLLKDSTSYLDHINGKKHQRALGYSMRVERAGIDHVKEKLDSLKRKISDQQQQDGPRPTAIEEYETRIALKKTEEENRKKKKREDELARRREEEEAELEAGIDPDLAQLMGFGGFGGSKKS